MQKGSLLLALCITVYGCAGARPEPTKTPHPAAGYRLSVTIERTTKTDEFRVAAAITAPARCEGSVCYPPEVIARPTLVCKAGVPASVRVTTDDGQSGYVLKVYVPRHRKDRSPTCSLTLQRAGRVLASARVRMPPPGR